MRFLMVEDDPVHTAMISSRLEDLGGEIESVGTVAHAIRKLGGDTAYDLVILDRHLVDGDGFEVHRCLKRIPNPPAVLYVTSEDRVEDAVEAMREGAAGYLVKRPEYLARLEKEVSRILNAPPNRGATSRSEFEARERAKLSRMLERNQWNVSAAAREMGIGRGKLRSRMAALGIDR